MQVFGPATVGTISQLIRLETVNLGGEQITIDVSTGETEDDKSIIQNKQVNLSDFI